MSDRAQHQVLRLQRVPLRGDVLVQREHTGGLAFESRDHDTPHVDCAVGLLHAQLERAVGVLVLHGHRARCVVDLLWLAAGHLGGLQAVDGFDLRVGVDDASTRVLEHHADRRVAQDRIHHPALTVEGVDELELAEKDRRLAGQDRGEPPRLGGAHSHSRHQQSGEAAFDLDRDGERVLR